MFIDFRKRGRERESSIDVREKHQLVASRMLPDQGLNPATQDQTHNLSVYGTVLQPTEPPGQGGSSIFKFLMKLHTVLHSDCTNLHFHQQCTSVPFNARSHQQLFLLFVITGILIGVKWYHIVALIRISLMIRDAEHLFMYQLDHNIILLNVLSPHKDTL